MIITRSFFPFVKEQLTSSKKRSLPLLLQSLSQGTCLGITFLNNSHSIDWCIRKDKYRRILEGSKIPFLKLKRILMRSLYSWKDETMEDMRFSFLNFFNSIGGEAKEYETMEDMRFTFWGVKPSRGKICLFYLHC